MSDLSFYDREERPWPNPRLTRASIVGHTTPSSVKLWFRVKYPGTYCVFVSRTPIPTDGEPEFPQGDADDGSDFVYRQERQFTFDTDLTEVFDIEDLDPDTTYYYALAQRDPREHDSEWYLGYEKTLTATTFPEPEEATGFSFGLFSCHMPYEGRSLHNAEMWKYFREELRDADSRFVIGAGDQVYSDGHPDVDIWEYLRSVKDQDPTREEMVSWYRDIYRGYWGLRDMRRVFREFPTYMIWDDHEIMDGWGSYTRDELSNQLDTMWEWENQGQNLALADDMFDAARQVYGEYQHSHNPDTEASDQWDYHFEYGPCAFFVLDMRGHRDYEREGHRILGEEQLERVVDWLEQVERPLAFIVSPVPVVHASNFVVNNFDLNLLGIADDLRDEWEHETNWKERNELLEAVFNWSAENDSRLFFLSGDVHLGAAFKIVDPGHTDASVYQLTSSGITYAGLNSIKREALEAAVEEHGKLGDKEDIPADEHYYFNNLRLFSGNNFGLLRLRRSSEDEPWRVLFDLYGQSRDFDAVVRIDRLEM